MTTAKTNVQAGLFLTNQHPAGADLVAAQRGQIDMVRHARDNGWDSVFAGQHFLPTSMAMLQPVPFLARIAADSGSMRLGLGILLLPLLNPVYVAETVASLDVLSGGRLIFGVGLGYRDVEYAAFGLSRADGVDRLETNLDIIDALWSRDNVSVDVPWCRLANVSLNVKPVQKPRPPLWFAANSDAAVRRAARLGDAWMINPHATFKTIRRQLDLYHAAVREAKRPTVTELPMMREIYCGPDAETAWDRAGPYLASKYKVYANWGQDRVMPTAENFGEPIQDLASDRFIIGSAEDCIEALLPWRDDIGINHFIFRTHWSGMPPDIALESMKILSDQVIPRLKAGV